MRSPTTWDCGRSRANSSTPTRASRSCGRTRPASAPIPQKATAPSSLLRWGRCQSGQEHEPKFTTLLGAIMAPTLVVTSDNDQLIPRELSELIAARIPNAKLAVMPGAGHIPFMEQPGEVVRIVLEFVAALRD